MKGLIARDESLYSPAAEYSKRDVAKIIGRTPRNITYWTDFGLVVPDIKPSQGRGVQRLYSDRNLIEFAMIDVMVKEMNISLDIIQRILKDLREGYDTEEAENRLRYAGRIFKSDQENLQKPTFFKDFYTSQKWGVSQELAVVIWICREIIEPVLFYNVLNYTGERAVELDPNPNPDPDDDLGPLYCTVIWLGRIKKWAIDKHLLWNLPKGFDPSKRVIRNKK